MTKRRSIPALMAATLGCATVAWAAEPSQQDLQKQIEQLQSQLQELKTTRATPAFSGKDVDATVDSVLRDADRRSQLLAETGGGMAGWMDDGFHIMSADGNYDLQPFFQFQFRYVNNFRDGSEDDGDDDDDVRSDDGFEIRRMKIGAKGHAISKKLKYEFRWATERSGGSLILENAFITYEFADTWAFRVGQWKDNWTHEENVSSGKQLTVERSLLNELLAGGLTDYVQGVSLIWDSGNIRGEFAYHDGAGSRNTNYMNSSSSSAIFSGGANWGASGRVEFLAMGDWKAYDDFSAMNNKKDLLVIGGGGDYTQSGDTDVFFHTVDVQWEGSGMPLGIYGAFVGQWIEGGATGGDDGYNWGVLFQGGYMLDKQLELFARFDWISFDEEVVDLDEEDIYEITAGINYYLKGHNAKVTIDVTWLPDGSPSSVSGNGVKSGTEDQFIIRGQFQLLI